MAYKLCADLGPGQPGCLRPSFETRTGDEDLVEPVVTQRLVEEALEPLPAKPVPA